MKAVIGMRSGIELNTIHNNVVQIESVNINRRFKCNDCGLIFEEHLNGMTVIKDDDAKYFNDYKNCTDNID